MSFQFKEPDLSSFPDVTDEEREVALGFTRIREIVVGVDEGESEEEYADAHAVFFSVGETDDDIFAVEQMGHCYEIAKSAEAASATALSLARALIKVRSDRVLGFLKSTPSAWIPEKGKPPSGFLEVGTSGSGNVVVNHPDLTPDENGVGHIIFSPDEARNLAALLEAKALQADGERS